MRYARIYPWRRTRRFRAPSNGPEAFFVAQFSAGYTTNMFGFDLRQGQECLDHVVVSGERHLRHVLLSYLKYYNEVRTHLSLEKDAPISRAVERAGSILCRPVLGGLHHQYVRI